MRHWYESLETPDLSFPIIILAPIHFAAIVISSFGVKVVMANLSGNPAVFPARKLYGAWLFLHSVWLVLFAGLHLPVISLGFGMFEWGIAVLCIQKFYNVDPVAGRRILLFFLVTSYLMYVNAAILSLNNY